MGTIEVKDMAEWNLLQKHMRTASYIRERLEKGAPLTAQEVDDGVRMSHEEYVDLVKRAVRDWTNRNPPR